MEEKFEFEETQRSAEFFKFLSRVLRNWYWIAGSVILAAVIAYMIVRYEDPIYRVKASFVTKKFDETNSGTLGGIIDANPFRQRIEVYQEIPLLKSEDKIRETIERLNFGISYFIVGRFKTSEIYKDYHFTVKLDSSSTFIPYGLPIYISVGEGNSYSLSSEDEKLNKTLAGNSYQFGATNNINGWKFSIFKNKDVDEWNGYSYYFTINHINTLVNEYVGKLQISWQQEGSAILDGVILSELPEKDYRFITTYLDVITEKALEDKNQYLINTIEFINEYMYQLSDTLLKYQDKIDQFRIENREIISGSEVVFTKLAALDEEKAQLMLENRYFDYITKYIEEKKTDEVFAPALLGIESPLLSQLIGKYIDIKWTDKIELNEANSKNPLVNKGSEEYLRVEKNLYESIRTRRQSNLLKIKEINNQINSYYNSLSELQIESREYDELRRMLMLYQSTVNALLSKRTDASIAKAATTSDYQIVTSPSYSSIPIYPDRDKVFLISVLIGLAFPIGLIYLFMILNEKIISKEDLKKNTNIPLIGNIGHSIAHTNKVMLEKPKSNVAESFRGIKANLQYFTPGNGESKVFLITSSISSEGKTFCSTNLSYTFALTSKKTILLGADMRKPSLSQIFNLKHEKGLSQYLAGMASLEEVIYPSDMESLFILPAGTVPPNPAELLSSKRMEELIAILKRQYEVIVVDTPPIGLVADTMELIRLADANLLIVRQSKTYKKSLAALTELYNDGKMQNLGILFNDIDFTKYEYGKGYSGYGNKYGYSYGYGYGYYSEENGKKPFLKRLLGK